MSVKENLMPMVSVVMSVYNEEQHVSQAMESILNQTFNDFEFIIVNDGSVDKTYEIIERYAEKDKRVRVINHEKREGQAKSLNDGIKIAKGKYIARMDADDISLPERLEKQVKFMGSHPEVGVLGTYYKEIDNSGKILPRKQNPSTWEQIKKALFYYNPVCHPSVMMRKELILEVGGYDEKFSIGQDYDLFSRLISKTKIENLPEFLIIHRFPEEIFDSWKSKRGIIAAIRIKLGLIRRKIYPLYYMIFLIKPILELLIQVRLREKIRRFRHRKYK